MLVGCGRDFVENRRTPEGRGIREKRDGVVPQPPGRNLQTPSGVPPGFIGAGLFGIHACLEKSFNRGFTRYFLDGRTPDIFSFHTPNRWAKKWGR